MKRDELKPIESRAFKIGFDKKQFEREASFALQIWNDPKNSYLRKATKESMMAALLNVAQVGLTLNPVSKEAYLVPRYDSNSKSVIACLQPSYIGLVKLLTDSGSVTSIKTNVVYEGDEIDVDLSLDNPIVKHVPYMLKGNLKGKVVMVYSMASLSDGSKQVELMSKAEIDEIRDISESYKAFKDNKVKSSIWNTWESEMCRKTVIRRFAKYLPRTNQHQYIDNAINLDNQEFEARNYQLSMIESLLSNANILDAQKEQIERQLSSINFHEANKVIEFLKDNQLNAIQSGNNYSAADIHKELDNKMNDENS